jgi:hypothetical protein
MPQENDETAANGANPVDVKALFRQLEDEVRRTGPQRSSGRGGSVRLDSRATAERLWRVTADRPPGGRTGAVGTLQRPVKLAVRKLARWYVEPVFADQRAVNDALIKLVDELADEVDELRARVDELERARPQ